MLWCKALWFLLHRCYSAEPMFVNFQFCYFCPLCTDVVVQGFMILIAQMLQCRIIIGLFSVLGWIVITHPIGVAGYISQYFCLMWDCSLWCIWPPLLLLPYCDLLCLLFWSFPQMLCGQCYFGVHVWEMVLLGVPCTFLQMFWMTPLYTPPCSQSCHIWTSILHCFFFLMLSLSLGDTSKFLSVFPPLKYTCIPYFLQMFLKLSAIPLEYGTTMWHIFFCDTGCCFFLLVLEYVCLWRTFVLPILDICNPLMLFLNVPILIWWNLVWNIVF